MKRLSLLLALILVISCVLCSCEAAKTAEIKGNSTGLSNTEELSTSNESDIYDYENIYGTDKSDVNLSNFDSYKKTVYTSKDAPDFQITDYKDGVCINKYTGTDKNVVIPEKIGGKPVLIIGSNFYEESYRGEQNISSESPFKNVSSITIPSTVEYFVSNYCEIKTIIVDKNNRTFASQNGILYSKDMAILLLMPQKYQSDKFTIPESVKRTVDIGSDKCQNITVSKNVKSMYEYCDVLYNVVEDNPYFSSDKGVLYNKDKTKLLYYPRCKTDKEYSVPDTVTEMKDDFHYIDNLKILQIGKKIIDIPIDFDYGTSFDGVDSSITKTCSITTIKGYRSTAAETFAKDNNLKFVALD